MTVSLMASASPDLSGDQALVWSKLVGGPLPMSALRITQTTRVPLPRVLDILTRFEIAGWVRQATDPRTGGKVWYLHPMFLPN